MILIIGSLPPPIGGVNVFVQRRVAGLRATGQTVTVLPPRPVAKLLWRLLRLDRNELQAVEVHSMRLSMLLILQAFALIGRTAVYDHNHSRRFATMSAWQRRVLRWLLSRVAEIRLVSEHLRRHYDGMTSGRSLPLRVVEPEVAPDLAQRASILEGYPEWVVPFWSQDGPRLIIGAWKPVVSDGGDLYGLHSAVDLAAELAATLPGLCMLITIADPLDGEFVRGLTRRIAGLGADDRVRLLTGQYPMWPLIETAHLFVRPTLTDGNSVSVLEALSFGVPVVASDCVTRPANVTTFATGDHTSFVSTTATVLRNTFNVQK